MRQTKDYHKIDATFLHLIFSILLASGVMIFINQTIGDMGGSPAWIAFFVVYYMIKGGYVVRYRTKHQKSLERKAILRQMLGMYILGYIVLWTITKAALIVMQMLGWGNIPGLSTSDYFSSIYGASLVERWAFLFAIILMFAFIISLFPLIIICDRKRWLGFLLVDGVFYIGVNHMVRRICFVWIDKETKGNVVYTIDALRSCVTPYHWQAGLFLQGAMALLLIAVVASYTAGKRQIGNASVLEKNSMEKEFAEEITKEKNKYLSVLLLVAMLMFAIGMGTAAYRMNRAKNKKAEAPAYEGKSSMLTRDTVLGPLFYNEKVYLPERIALNYAHRGRTIGYALEKGEDENGYFFEGSSLLYGQKNVKVDGHLKVAGDINGSYGMAEAIEMENAWQEDVLFVLWDEEWESESRFSKNRTGYSIVPRELVAYLEETYGEVSYEPQDFSEYDAFFSIYGYQSPSEAFVDDSNVGHWVGCVLIKDDEFYYGNYKNHIEGETKQMLNEVLGGNVNPVIDTEWQEIMEK